MKASKFLLWLGCAILCNLTTRVIAQSKVTLDSTEFISMPVENLVLDGAYQPEGNEVKRLIPYAPLREADVMYQKRIWQEMDLRQKFNHPYYYPLKRIADRANLFDVITDAVFPELSGSPYQLNTYKDDEFSELLSKEDIRKSMLRSELVDVEDDDGNVTGEKKKLFYRLSSQEITRYQIKEDWIWDKQRSERYIRIIAIAPCKEVRNGSKYEYEPLFWLDWRECRYVFMNAEAYNPFNDAQRRTYEDLFRKRYFSSYIIKEGNTFDRRIADYAFGVAALSTSEKIQSALFNLEHDMWNY